MYGRIALVVGLVVGASAPTVAARPSARPSGRAAAPSSQAPKRAAHLSRCVDVPGAQCGTIERPLDPQDPGGATITIGFELHRATNRNRPSLGTIVAVEGGPGYPSTGSRDFYLDLFAPLLARRDVLLVDARGTGTSSVITCPELESFQGDYIDNVGLCGAQLGAASDVYGTAFAADDLAAVLDLLKIDRIDLYGDSYGTFFGQTFAIRHPDRIRTLTLDAAYPVEDQDPWYRDENRAMRSAFRLVCQRDPGCAALGGDVIDRLAALADALRDDPLAGQAYDADGVLRDVEVDAPFLSYLMGVATYGTTVYEELDGAGRAWLEHGDPAPLLRIAAEQTDWSDAGVPEEFSNGLYVSVICNDYPQLWDINAPLDQRPAQFDASVADLRATDADAFAPFTVDDWLASPWTEFESCIKWPAPDPFVPPVESPAVYPTVPTLVLVGDLDSITSAEGAHIVADRFPNSTFVEVANTGHVTALVDYSRCASDIVVAFVNTRAAGDTSCASQYQEVRTTDEFPARLNDVGAAPGPGTARQRRVASAVTSTVGDLFPRWFAMLGEAGVGLRGGTFTTTGLDVVHFNLANLRWVENLAVSGRVKWDRATGAVTATVTCARAADCRLTVTWNYNAAHATATITGTIDGQRVSLTQPAP
jgi:pimeloyl-ACP methyl ester carboxylesterase